MDACPGARQYANGHVRTPIGSAPMMKPIPTQETTFTQRFILKIKKSGMPSPTA